MWLILQDLGSHSGTYEKFCFLGYDTMKSTELTGVSSKHSQPSDFLYPEHGGGILVLHPFVTELFEAGLVFPVRAVKSRLFFH
jgi:hypothetical protein